MVWPSYSDWKRGAIFGLIVFQMWMIYKYQTLAHEQNGMIARYQKIIHDLPDACVVPSDQASIVHLLKHIYESLPYPER